MILFDARGKVTYNTISPGARQKWLGAWKEVGRLGRVSKAPKGWGVGEGPLPTGKGSGEGLCPSAENFEIFATKCRFGALWCTIFTL